MTEKEKYDIMHKIPGYSPGPGISYVRVALPFIKDSAVIDFGCGTGDAANAFKELGNEIYCVDISGNGLRHNLPFFECALHDLPDELPHVPWGFCCDVMEHVPPELVDASLLAMSEKADNCFFGISEVPDSWGKHIGEPLHLTVKPAVWWVMNISKHWPDVWLMEDTGNYCVIVARSNAD